MNETKTITELLNELDKVLRVKPSYAKLLEGGFNDSDAPEAYGLALKIYEARKLLGLSLEANEQGLVSGDEMDQAEWSLALKLFLKEKGE